MKTSTPKQCQQQLEISGEYRQKIPEIVQQLAVTCNQGQCYEHLVPEPIPSREATIAIIYQAQKVLFPGYFTRHHLDQFNIEHYLGHEVSSLYEMLTEQIIFTVRHDCLRHQKSSDCCESRGKHKAIDFIKTLPRLRLQLAKDVRAAMAADPAAISVDEVIFSYPGLFAITVYRLAHLLRQLDVPLLPRIMTEYAHSKTGIDINPGAVIGEHFFIDHGTGIVIGETTEIGDRVRLYQGVTLGALSLPGNAGEKFRSVKRHPTIEDDVIIYSGATILGGETRVGARSVIGGNVWLTKSIPPDTKVVLKNPELIHLSQE